MPGLRGKQSITAQNHVHRVLGVAPELPRTRCVECIRTQALTLKWPASGMGVSFGIPFRERKKDLKELGVRFHLPAILHLLTL